MIGTFQKTLLEYVGSGKEIKYIANDKNESLNIASFAVILVDISCLIY